MITSEAEVIVAARTMLLKLETMLVDDEAWTRRNVTDADWYTRTRRHVLRHEATSLKVRACDGAIEVWTKSQYESIHIKRVDDYGDLFDLVTKRVKELHRSIAAEKVLKRMGIIMAATELPLCTGCGQRHKPTPQTILSHPKWKD